jgi:hypothetical protein
MNWIAAALGAAFLFVGSSLAPACEGPDATLARAMAHDAQLALVDDVIGDPAHELMAALRKVAPPPRAIEPSRIMLFRIRAQPASVLIVLFERECASLSVVLPRSAVDAMLGEVRA